MQSFSANDSEKIGRVADQRAGGCSGELTSSLPRSEMFAGFKVAGAKEKPVLSEAEKVRKANGCVFGVAVSRISSLSSGAAAIAALTTHRRSVGAVAAPARAIEAAASGLAAIAARMIRWIMAQSASGFPSKCLI